MGKAEYRPSIGARVVIDRQDSYFHGAIGIVELGELGVIGVRVAAHWRDGVQDKSVVGHLFLFNESDLRPFSPLQLLAEQAE